MLNLVVMLTSVIVFIAVLSILILVHEAGHFFAARKSGVLVEEFGFGIPPRIWGKKIGETLYSVNLLPFGGFVRLHGEINEEGVTQPERAFINLEKKKKAAIVTAGVIMNVILAIVVFSVVYSFTGIPRQTDKVKVVGTAESSPAVEVGLEDGQVISEVDGQSVNSVQEFQEIVSGKLGQEIELTVRPSEGDEYKTQITPREDPPEGEGALGIIITDTEIYYPPVWQRPFYGAYYGLKEAVFWGKTVVVGFASIFQNLFAGEVPKDLAGPVGIFAITSQAAEFGVLSVLNLIGILSVNLAFLNILPFPALDGGRLSFIVIESVLGKKIVPRAEAIAHTVGMVILLALLFAITAYDVQRLISSGGISGFIDSVLEGAKP